MASKLFCTFFFFCVEPHPSFKNESYWKHKTALMTYDQHLIDLDVERLTTC